MVIRKFCIVSGFLSLLAILVACNDGSALWPQASGTYEVNATVNYRSLDEYPVIKSHDKIAPYFTNFDTNDPDVQGLVVFLQTSEGSPLAGTIHYHLSENAIQKKQAAVPAALSNEKDAEEPSPLEPLVAPPVEEAPPPEPPETSGLVDQTFTVEQLEEGLPEFEIDPSLAVGQYLMVFQVKGKTQVLYEIQRAFYFIADAEFVVHDVRRYFPAPASIEHLAPPSIPIMLEARIDADPRLQPYLIWYNGNKRIEEGAISKAGRLIWPVPAQTGFQNIRVEVFPFAPTRNLSGEIRALSLAVSSESELRGFFSKAPREGSRQPFNDDEYSYWYQLRDNLADDLFPDDPRRAIRLVGNAEAEPRWLPAGELYGLTLGPQDRYELPIVPFFLAEGTMGVEQFLFHIKPLGDGVVFQTSFYTKEALDGTLKVQLVFLGDTALLRINKADETLVERPFSMSEFQNGDFLTVRLNIALHEKQLSASLGLGEGTVETEPAIAALKQPLSGERSFYLGMMSDKTDAVAILDELAVSFMRVPLALEDAIQEKIGEMYSTTSEFLQEGLLAGAIE
ncbi:MAG: hypothetical protein LBS86_08105 [Treponema sp.]|jgi:hypothetical protein|nr:hypothetical protein [Treponema sp.]